jgi:hypothetical protein
VWCLRILGVWHVCIITIIPWHIWLGLEGNGFLLFSYAVMAILDETLAGIVIA